ncbi:MAG TPA: hypothetical protein VFP84_09195 [Kofleriaceae bacterium]|nr:hypothetical protein [Kofleriaceae bacterium]
MHRFLSTAVLGIVLASGSTSCGNKSSSPSKAKDDAALGPASPSAAPLAMPVLGVDQIKRFNFPYGEGRPAHDKAIAAYRKKDWASVRAQSEIAVGKDATHLGAHRLLAAALAQTGEPAAAVDHLVAALAGDYGLYAPTLADDDLKGFMASPHGEAVKALAAKIQDEYARRAASGLWLVGRRADFAWPRELGVQWSTSRGELYAFDRETKRFLRLSHTDHQVVGFVRAAGGGEVALVGFDKIDRPKADGDAAPLIARPWLQVLDTKTWKPITPRINLPAAREVALGYAAGDQLLVATAPATGRWTTGEPAIASVDKASGKLTKVATALPADHLVISLDESHAVRIPDGVTAAWTGDPPVAASLKAGPAGKPIAIPESGAASQASIALAPDAAHLAFATAADPCAKDAAPSLYVADTKTATVKHLLSARSRFATRWLDATTLAYDDGDNAIRLWDAQTGREALRIDDRSGLALDVLSIAAAPLCKQAPPSVEAGGAGDEPLPPEEAPGSGAGPITAPQ